MYQDLAAFYENPEVPNSFGGVEALHRSVKGKYSKKGVKHWLSQKDAYTLHKPVRHKFQRNRVFDTNKTGEELFTVYEIVQRIPIAYRLKDLQGEEIKGNMKSEFVVDAWSNFSVFYVYSDLISPQIVGDTQPPLLRIVRTKGQDGETVSQYYDRPQYLPLVRHSFQTIKSELRLNSGDFVPFERGSGLIYYKGINFQKGYGIGGIFCRLFRAALPFLVKGGKTIGKEVLMIGSRVASHVLSGEHFKEAVTTKSRESGKN
ncbi:uncharacterized protein TNCV_3295361 [Trichonephila clavipes]|uniref:Uncharacterized protein n=1 Tax=Trichonephila clavipes TaxID=2585209 RepID=A0A8X6VK95_TRICX|nr:uncharacterized protein TNCV_3295361 [Trichonephila clavipes]